MDRRLLLRRRLAACLLRHERARTLLQSGVFASRLLLFSKKNGFTVMRVSDGVEALDCLKRTRSVSLKLLDLMPNEWMGIPGEEKCRSVICEGAGYLDDGCA